MRYLGIDYNPLGIRVNRPYDRTIVLIGKQLNEIGRQCVSRSHSVTDLHELRETLSKVACKIENISGTFEPTDSEVGKPRPA
jgi:hypothetical protein